MKVVKTGVLVLGVLWIVVGACILAWSTLTGGAGLDRPAVLGTTAAAGMMLCLGAFGVWSALRYNRVISWALMLFGFAWSLGPIGLYGEANAKGEGFIASVLLIEITVAVASIAWGFVSVVASDFGRLPAGRR